MFLGALRPKNKVWVLYVSNAILPATSEWLMKHVIANMVILWTNLAIVWVFVEMAYCW